MTAKTLHRGCLARGPHANLGIKVKADGDVKKGLPRIYTTPEYVPLDRCPTVKWQVDLGIGVPHFHDHLHRGLGGQRRQNNTDCRQGRLVTDQQK